MTMFEDDIEAMLGGKATLDAAPVLERPSSRTEDRTERRIREAQERRLVQSGENARDVLQGVSISWISRVFNMDPSHVRRKLATAPALRISTSGNLYDVKVAAQYLVKPKIDPVALLKAVKANELPPALQDAYWSAIKKRNHVELEAGELWHTDDVYAAFAGMFKTIRETFQLVPDELERNHAMPQALRHEIVDMLNKLQADLQTNLKALAAERETQSVRARVQREADETL